MTAHKRSGGGDGVIVLIYPRHSPFPHSVSTPLSIFYLGSFLERESFRVEYFDERIHSPKVLKELLEGDVLLSGISSMTSYQITRGLAISSCINKVSPDIPIVWGGIHPSMCPEQTIESPLVHFVVCGEGELTLLELAKTLREGTGDFGSIPGLVWKDGPKTVVNEERKFLDFNLIPSPYYGKAREMLMLYTGRKDVREPVGIQTSRGCRFRCRFCYNRFFNKKTIRLKNLDTVEQELAEVKSLGAGSILFYDDNIGYDRERILGICDITRCLGINWSADLSLNFLDSGLIRAMEESGCSYLFFGAESPSDRVLRYINKGQTSAQLKEGVKLMAQSSIKPMYSLMMGFPACTEDDLRETIDFASWIHETDPRAEIGLQPYTPYPGTPLYEESLEAGFKPPKTLAGWGLMTMDYVNTPWVKDKLLLRNLFLLSFLAFRYEKFLTGSPVWCLHKLALFRWNRKLFRFCFERIAYDIYKWFYRLLYKISGL
ncbi:MAG: radical SAM protein [Candidatus Tritonobacter lacicola]|nr:radical SAM protein [Candidatus Tritonobacter lacicola]